MKSAAINVSRHEFLNLFGSENANLPLDTEVACLGYNFEGVEYS
jgi:hypothetical protein